MPIHPLKGLKLKLVSRRRDHFAGCETVIAEVADGSHLVLPIDWTDRGKPWVTPRLAGRDVRLSPGGLLSLTRAVEAALRQKLGPTQKGSSACTEAELPDQSNVSWRNPSGGVDRSHTNNTARATRRVVQSAAQDAQRKRGRR